MFTIIGLAVSICGWAFDYRGFIHGVGVGILLVAMVALISNLKTVMQGLNGGTKGRKGGD